jgi:hypothetical protein
MLDNEHRNAAEDMKVTDDMNAGDYRNNLAMFAAAFFEDVSVF